MRSYLYGNILSLAQGEKIYKIRQRLRIEGANASGKDHILEALPVLPVEGNAREPQHIQNVGIGHLVADGKSHHIESLHRVLTLQSPVERLDNVSSLKPVDSMSSVAWR